MMNPLSPRQLLQWHLDAGVDETIADAPMDYYKKDQAANAPLPASAPQPLPAAPPGPALGKITSASSRLTRGADELLHGACELAAHATSLDQLRQALASFDGCALRKTATNLVFADGNPNARIIFIGEAPGAEEDRQGVPFVGPSGKLLDRMLASIGLDRKSAFITNTVFWRPPGNRTPTTAEMAVCMPFVERLVELVDPEILVALGAPAARSMLAQTANISRIRGTWFSYTTPRLARPIAATATYHPAYLLRTPGQKPAAWRDLLAIKKKLMLA